MLAWLAHAVLLGAGMQPNASILVTFGIPTLALIALALIGFAIQRTSGARAALRYALGAGAWLAFTGVLAAAGFFADFDARPPRALFLVIPTLALPILLARSAAGRALGAQLPLAALVGFHAFRLPLELVMHEAAVEGTMPNQMSFSGANFDIVTGGTAIAVALLAAFDRAPRWLLLAWNALGSLLLATIVIIALASMPMIRAFGDDPSRLNTWVAYFPFVWLAAGLVAAALFGHLVLWRRLLALNPSSAHTACPPALAPRTASARTP